MKARHWLALGAAIAIAGPAAAQPVPRLRAKIMAFDGDTLTLQPDGTTADSDWVRVAVRPDTRYVSTEKYKLAAIQPGDFAGAAVIVQGDGKLRAQEVHVYPGALRGSGEGRFAEGAPTQGNNERLMVNGTVASSTGGMLTLHYRGAALNNNVCEGRAPVPLTPTACAGDAAVTVAPGIPVTALTVGDKTLLIPGAMAIVSVVTRPDGAKVTPGLIVEKPASSP